MKIIFKIFIVFFSSYLIFSGSVNLMVKISKAGFDKVSLMADKADDNLPDKETEDTKEEDSKEEDKDEKEFSNSLDQIDLVANLLLEKQNHIISHNNYFNSILIEIVPQPPEA